MSNKSFLRGKRELRKLNGHQVKVIVPDEKLSYEEGVKRIQELAKKYRK